MKYFHRMASIICSLCFFSFFISCETEDVKPIPPTIPTIGDFNIPAKKMGSSPFEITAPSSNSKGAFSYTSSNTAVATVSGNTITILSVGSTTITATQSAAEGYASATVSTVFEVTLLDPPTLGAFSIPSKMNGSAPFQIVAPTSNSGGAFSYSSSNTNVATINGNTITIVGVGTSVITANQASFGTFAAASVQTNFVVTASIPPADIASDNFDIAAGTALTSSGWLAHSSTTTNPVLAVSPGLSFPDYFGSGIGNAAALSKTGQDVSLQFTAVTSGSVYASFLINATASPLCVDEYFFGFSNNLISSTAYRARLNINQDAVDKSKFKFGFAANSAASNPTASIKYSPNLYNYGTTYLVVVKYKIVPTGTLNVNGIDGRDESSVYIFEAGNNYSTEPATATIGIEDTSSPDINPGRVALRQDDVNSPNVVIDGLRVSKSWNLRN